jgi:hypothetical protein
MSKTKLKKNYFDVFLSEKNLHHGTKHALNIKNKDLALGLVFLYQYIVLLERKRLNREILFEKKKKFCILLYRFIFIVYKNKKIFLSNLICLVGHEEKLEFLKF